MHEHYTYISTLPWTKTRTRTRTLLSLDESAFLQCSLLVFLPHTWAAYFNSWHSALILLLDNVGPYLAGHLLTPPSNFRATVYVIKCAPTIPLPCWHGRPMLPPPNLRLRICMPMLPSASTVSKVFVNWAAAAVGLVFV